MNVELIPAIDLRDGKVVRLLRGDYSRETAYLVDPVEVARRFEEAGCRWLHVVDLDGAREGRPLNLNIIEKIIRSTGLSVEVGGGLRTEESMEYALAIGAQRIILGTRALADMQWFETVVHDARFSGRIALGLDAREGIVSTHGWTRAESDGPRAVDLARQVDDWPLAAIISTDIARDGTLKGPNLSATAKLTKVVKKVPLIHSGGVGSLADIVALRSLRIAGVIVGRALYEDALDARAAVEALRAGDAA